MSALGDGIATIYLILHELRDRYRIRRVCLYVSLTIVLTGGMFTYRELRHPAGSSENHYEIFKAVF
jgi:hypothetical protein